MDETDMKIIKALQEDASRSMRKISKAINVPLTTVHSRITALKKSKIIKRTTIDVDWYKLGRPILAFVSAEVDYTYSRAEQVTQNMIADKIIKHPAVESARTVTGQADILVKLRVSSISELDDFLVRDLRNIEGVTKTRTTIVLYEAQRKSMQG